MYQLWSMKLLLASFSGVPRAPIPEPASLAHFPYSPAETIPARANFRQAAALRTRPRQYRSSPISFDRPVDVASGCTRVFILSSFVAGKRNRTTMSLFLGRPDRSSYRGVAESGGERRERDRSNVPARANARVLLASRSLLGRSRYANARATLHSSPLFRSRHG